MDYLYRSKKAKSLADIYARERLGKQGYSKDLLQAFDLVQTPRSPSGRISLEIILLDIAWQISGHIPSEIELAKAFFPIQCIFLGTVYQDDLLDSLQLENPRALVRKLGNPTCMIMGNILYCEGLLSLIEFTDSKNNKKNQKLLESLKKLVHTVSETEIFRRDHIGHILPSIEFYRIWRQLSPNISCIEIGGIFGNSDEKEIQILSKIGSNFSLLSRILKEVNEMYGLRGSLKEKLRNKPPPLPITIGYELASSIEKKDLDKRIKNLATVKYEGSGNSNPVTGIENLIDILVKYDTFSRVLTIHRKISEETSTLISQLSDSEHRNVLNSLLGGEMGSQDVRNPNSE